MNTYSDLRKHLQKRRMMTGSKAKPKANCTSRASRPRKRATKSNSPPKAGAKAKPGASEAKTVKLLAGGNPQIAKGDGDVPVQAYIAAMAGCERDAWRPPPPP